MAVPSDPTFGAGFNADVVRSALRSAMQMGLPNTVAERPTFRWSSKSTFENAAPSGNPYDLSAPAVSTSSRADVQVPVAVEFVARSTLADGTPFGDINVPRAVVTVLDVDYLEIEGADQVLLGGATYTIDYVAPPVGLFTMTVYQLYCSAVDEV